MSIRARLIRFGFGRAFENVSDEQARRILGSVCGWSAVEFSNRAGRTA